MGLDRKLDIEREGERTGVNGIMIVIKGEGKG